MYASSANAGGEKPRGIEKLSMHNHTLYRRVQHLVRLNWKWEAIALDVAVPNVQALCEWVLAYKEPKHDRFANGGYINNVPVKRKQSPEEMTARFLAWKKQQEGAKDALKAFEFGPPV